MELNGSYYMPAALGACAFVALAVQLVDLIVGRVPERSRCRLHPAFTCTALFAPPLLTCTSGYLFWRSAPPDLAGVYVTYYSLLCIGLLLHAAVPRVDQVAGALVGRCISVAAFMLVYGALALSVNWAVDVSYVSNLWPHCGAVVLWAVYDWPFYIVSHLPLPEATPLLVQSVAQPV